MSDVAKLLSSPGPVGPVAADAARLLAGDVGKSLRATVYPESVISGEGAAYMIARVGADKCLAALTLRGSAVAADLVGQSDEITIGGEKLQLVRCTMTPANASALRKHVAMARPTVLGLATSAGMGDRLGLATPAHLAAVKDSKVLPIVAQQSIREMTRTGRSPQQVMDDALWGVMQAGWARPWGTDADHLKTTADVDATAAAGFLMFTIDPGEHVDNATDSDDGPECRAKFDRLPWNELEISAADCREAYQDRTFKLPGGKSVTFSEADVKVAAVKYGRAILHTVRMYRHIVRVMGSRPFELEMSVDETDSPTSPIEHYFVANELRRLGVKPTSLAPRFVGKFEKGVDYQGDIDEFRRQFAIHAAIARELGPYKLSLHSGSDKFSIYAMTSELTGGLVHLKTAGTSYLEALRAIARTNAPLFREILGFAIARYPEDKASYHVSAEVSRVKRPDELKDDQLETVLDDFHGRQVLHVTFGSVLTADGGNQFRIRLMDTLRRREDAHYLAVSSHLKRHIEPFNR